MNRQLKLVSLGAALIMVSGCAAQKVLVPPRIDLGGYGTIGVMEFSSNMDRDLREFATQRLVQAMQSAQRGVPVLELGSVLRVLDAIGHDELSFEAIRAIGEKYQVDTVLVGKLNITEIKPKVHLSTSLTSLNLKAQVEASLSVKLQATDSGATRWTKSARGAKTVAQANLLRHGASTVSAGDPENVYSGLVASLVHQVTYDFRSHYE